MSPQWRWRGDSLDNTEFQPNARNFVSAPFLLFNTVSAGIAAACTLWLLAIGEGHKPKYGTKEDKYMAIRIKRVPVRVPSRVRVNGRTATVTTRSTVGGRTTVRTKTVRV